MKVFEKYRFSSLIRWIRDLHVIDDNYPHITIRRQQQLEFVSIMQQLFIFKHCELSHEKNITIHYGTS